MMTTLKDLRTPAKLALSFFLMSVLIGTMSALIMLGLLLSEKDAGIAMPTLEKIKIKYHYPVIVSSMKTSMYKEVSNDKDIDKVEQWVANGADKKVFKQDILPIMKRDCTKCHSRTSTMTDAIPSMPLSTYKEVMSQTHAGYSWKKMSKQAHVHLFGIGTFLLIITMIFAYSSLFSWLKNLLIIVSWVALFADVLCWWVTKYVLGFAYFIVLAGAAMSGSVIIICILSLMDLWFDVPFFTDKSEAKIDN
jgi:hypothetical protein